MLAGWSPKNCATELVVRTGTIMRIFSKQLPASKGKYSPFGETGWVLVGSPVLTGRYDYKEGINDEIPLNQTDSNRLYWMCSVVAYRRCLFGWFLIKQITSWVAQ